MVGVRARRSSYSDTRGPYSGHEPSLNLQLASTHRTSLHTFFFIKLRVCQVNVAMADSQ